MRCSVPERDNKAVYRFSRLLESERNNGVKISNTVNEYFYYDNLFTELYKMSLIKLFIVNVIISFIF